MSAALRAQTATVSRQREAMEHVKASLRQNNYAIVHRDDLFGDEEAEAWDAAEDWMARFAASPQAAEFEQAYVDSVRQGMDGRAREALKREREARMQAEAAAMEQEIADIEARLAAAQSDQAAAAAERDRARAIAAKAAVAEAGNALKAARIRRKELAASHNEERNRSLSGFKPYVFTHKGWLGRGIRYSDAPIMLTASDRLLEIAGDYLGERAKVRIPTAWRVSSIPKGAPLPERAGSQRWHRDQTDSNILKLFIYFTDVTEATGALEYIPSSLPTGCRWSEAIPFTGATGYPPQSLIEEKVGPDDVVKCVGRKGTLVFVDTAGLHRGGYATEGCRVTVQSTYLRSETRIPATPLLPAGRDDPTLAETQRFAFS